jgi:hypothetical protein
LLAVLSHDGRRRSEPDADFAIGADKRAFGGYAADDIFGRHRPPGWRVFGHGCQLMPVTGTAVKNVGKDGAPFQDAVGRGKSALLRGFRKRDVVYCGVTLQVSLQKRENIGNDCNSVCMMSTA